MWKVEEGWCKKLVPPDSVCRWGIEKIECVSETAKHTGKKRKDECFFCSPPWLPIGRKLVRGG